MHVRNINSRTELQNWAALVQYSNRSWQHMFHLCGHWTGSTLLLKIPNDFRSWSLHWELLPIMFSEKTRNCLVETAIPFSDLSRRKGLLHWHYFLILFSIGLSNKREPYFFLRGCKEFWFVRSTSTLWSRTILCPVTCRFCCSNISSFSVIKYKLKIASGTVHTIPILENKVLSLTYRETGGNKITLAALGCKRHLKDSELISVCNYYVY